MRASLSGTVRVGLVAGLLLMLLAMSVVGLRIVDDSPRTDRGDSAQLLVPYDASFVNVWVRGCVASGESRAFCRCAIDEYTTRLRPDEFETASAVAHSGGELSELPRNVRDAIEHVERECR